MHHVVRASGVESCDLSDIADGKDYGVMFQTPASTSKRSADESRKHHNLMKPGQELASEMDRNGIIQTPMFKL